MYHRDGHIVNYVNATQFAAQMFGGLENLITLSLSLSLRYSPTVAHTLLRFADTRASLYGFSCIRATDGAAREEPSSLVLFRVATEVEHSSREASLFFVSMRRRQATMNRQTFFLLTI